MVILGFLFDKVLCFLGGQFKVLRVDCCPDSFQCRFARHYYIKTLVADNSSLVQLCRSHQQGGRSARMKDRKLSRMVWLAEQKDNRRDTSENPPPLISYRQVTLHLLHLHLSSPL